MYSGGQPTAVGTAAGAPHCYPGGVLHPHPSVTEEVTGKLHTTLSISTYPLNWNRGMYGINIIKKKVSHISHPYFE